MAKNASKKVVIGLSGGIDSAVSALLLKKRGFELIGVFMVFWAEAEKDGFENKCCSFLARERARIIAQKLNIPFYIFNFKREFKQKVVDYFLKETKKGQTPNPCIVCNSKIRFSLFLEKAKALGADFIATGHYARIVKKGKKIGIFLAKDKKKDQSYFLWQIPEKNLKDILFPLGEIKKEKVRKIAKEHKLFLKEVPESQEICFVKKDIYQFLEKKLGFKKGKIFDVAGNFLGYHQGLHFFTIGQRKKIGLSGGPWYVLRKDLNNNFLIVTREKKKLYKKRLIIKDINLFDQKIKFPLKALVKIRSQGNFGKALILAKSQKRFEILFERPQWALTPGQSAVFYKNEQLLGGGIIESVYES